MRGHGQPAVVIWTLVGVTVLCLLWFARGVVASWARVQASRCLEQHSASAALERLDWYGWLAPDDGRADLLRATAFRHLKRDEHVYFAVLESARRKGVPRAEIEREARLYAIESGTLGERADRELMELIEVGESPHDVCQAFVFGYLHRQDPENARRVLDAWAADFPGEPHVAYVRGVFWQSVGDTGRAESELRSVLAGEPGHELAAVALARLYEQQKRADAALEQWLDAVKRFPSSDAAHIGLAQLFRKSGHVAQARAVLASRVTQPAASLELRLEASDVEFESGSYEDACRLLREAHFGQESHFRELLARGVALALDGKSTQANGLMQRGRTAATALAFHGEARHAEWLFDEVDGIYSQLQRRHDLRVRLDQNPEDQDASRELDDLLARLSAADYRQSSIGSEDWESRPSTGGRRLYELHCAACHGVEGDGNGPAARHLDPRPSGFRRDPFKMVSTRNTIPSADDVAEVVRQGMPGTSMPAFGQLSAHERQALAEEVLRFRNAGVRERLVDLYRQENGELAEDELNDLFMRHTTPGSPEPIPPFDTPDASSLDRGKKAFVQLGCRSCHAGREPQQGALFFDQNGWPTPPRNLASDPFKGGREPSSVYLRLRLGMPGSAHPAAVSVPEEQLVDVVHYCLSLAQAPTSSLTNYQRSLRSCSLRTGSESETPAKAH